MKIQNSNLAATSPVIANTSSGTADSTAKAASSSSDAVQLSHLGSALSAASSKIFASPNQIDNLARIVRSGSYTVDPLELSQRIIADTQAA
jgi:anti-sigma28 factor (negative regulator of flagellin synthesis)